MSWRRDWKWQKWNTKRNLQPNNICEVWRAVNTISGYSKNKRQPLLGEVGRADELNQFFNWFYCVVTPTSTAAPPSLSPNSFQHVGIFSATPPIVCFSTTAPTSPCISNMAAISYLTPVLPPLSVTETKVGLELGRLCSGKVASPDVVSKTCLFTPLHSCFLCIRQLAINNLNLATVVLVHSLGLV